MLRVSNAKTSIDVTAFYACECDRVDPWDECTFLLGLWIILIRFFVC